MKTGKGGDGGRWREVDGDRRRCREVKGGGGRWREVWSGFDARGGHRGEQQRAELGHGVVDEVLADGRGERVDEDRAEHLRGRGRWG